MNQFLVRPAVLVFFLMFCLPSLLPGVAADPGDDAVMKALQERIQAYVDAFNSGDAAAVGKFWAENGESVDRESGARIEGRAAIEQDLAVFFQTNSGARLTGSVTHVRMVAPNVATVDGRTTLFVGDAEPVESTFTALLVKEGEEWLISSSHETDLPLPATPYEALKELEWMVGTWQDQTEEAEVTTTARWSPNRTFLIRSFNARFAEGALLQGTQVIGWDPLNRQIRDWVFNSDGSFAEGTVLQDGDTWLFRMSQILSDGGLAAATRVVTRIDDNTVTVETIGKTIDGEPAPATDPVTVVRVSGENAVPEIDVRAGRGGAQ